MSPATARPHVLVVSPPSPTTDRLLRYFAECAVDSTFCETVAAATEGAGATSIVIFPDELEAALTAASLRSFRLRQPGVSIAIVTRDTLRHGELIAEAGGDPRSWLVVPRPVWGFVLLDHVLDAARRRSGRGGERPPEPEPRR